MDMVRKKVVSGSVGTVGQRGWSHSGLSKAQSISLELDWLSSARSFLSVEPLAWLSSIISKF